MGLKSPVLEGMKGLGIRSHPKRLENFSPCQESPNR
ncbi:MAG: hypothetical protein RLZZ568_985 [Cyanobacteriota bacterium]|jgi:hypothetical protein